MSRSQLGKEVIVKMVKVEVLVEVTDAKLSEMLLKILFVTKEKKKFRTEKLKKKLKKFRSIFLSNKGYNQKFSFNQQLFFFYIFS